MISEDLFLHQIFHLKQQSFYRLRGIICYYGCHYNFFFFNHERQQWFMFDDSLVKVVASDRATIREKCIRGRLQPFALFYEKCREGESLLTSMNLTEASLKSGSFDFSDKKTESPVDSPRNFAENSNTSSSSELHFSSPISFQSPPFTLSDDELDVDEKPSHSMAMSSFTLLATHHDKSVFGDFHMVPKAVEPTLVDLTTVIEVEVMRINKWFRSQFRTYQFNADNFVRRIPSEKAGRDTFKYTEVEKIEFKDASNIVITFVAYSKESQYLYTSEEKCQAIAHIIRTRAESLGHEVLIIDLRNNN
eukprot:TRINITY_DN291_c0_g1_i1.p1 TRINITY_DN291_c0_g1~~TRINITY_DN291_c0_g1_i1.p1  ORF type:complete len:305 (-),score=48.23 TRINITY_DN291_c0_g1_i1:106-1020(-)